MCYHADESRVMYAGSRLVVPEILKGIFARVLRERRAGACEPKRHSLPVFSGDSPGMKFNPDRTCGKGGAYGRRQAISGSVHRENRDNVAYLNVNEGRAKLNWNWNDNANPKYGSASRREC